MGTRRDFGEIQRKQNGSWWRAEGGEESSYKEGCTSKESDCQEAVSEESDVIVLEGEESPNTQNGQESEPKVNRY